MDHVAQGGGGAPEEACCLLKSEEDDRWLHCGSVSLLNSDEFVFELQANTPNRGHATAFESVSFQICSDLCHDGSMTDEEQSEAKLTREEQSFAAEVRRLREKNALSQADLSDLLQKQGLPYVNKTMVSRIENATRPVRMIEAQALSEVFDVSIWKLMHPEEIDEYIESMRNDFHHARNSWRRLRESLAEWEQKQAEIRGMADDLDAEATKWKGDQSRLRELQRLAKAFRWYSSVDLPQYLLDKRTEQDGEHPEAS